MLVQAGDSCKYRQVGNIAKELVRKYLLIFRSLDFIEKCAYLVQDAIIFQNFWATIKLQERGI